MIRICLSLRWIAKYEFGSKRPIELSKWAFPAVYRWAVYGRDGRLTGVYVGESYDVCKRSRRYCVPRAASKRARRTTRRVSLFLSEEKRGGKRVVFELLDFDPFSIEFQGGRTDVNPKGLSGQAARRFLENLALLSVDRRECRVLNDDPDFFESRGRWAKRLGAAEDARRHAASV